jgi:hypothetical protein
MKRPSMTTQQRQYAREQRALLRLRRAAVRWSELDTDPGELLLVDLQAACDAYTTSLTLRERRMLLK